MLQFQGLKAMSLKLTDRTLNFRHVHGITLFVEESDLSAKNFFTEHMMEVVFLSMASWYTPPSNDPAGH